MLFFLLSAFNALFCVVIFIKFVVLVAAYDFTSELQVQHKQQTFIQNAAFVCQRRLHTGHCTGVKITDCCPAQTFGTPLSRLSVGK